MTRLLYSVPLWLAYSSVAAMLWVIGVPLIAVLAWRRAWVIRPSEQYADKRMLRYWKGRWLTWIWSNSEDGVTGAQWYRELHADWWESKQALMWSAFRNPTNNMRFIPLVNPHIVPSRIHYVGAFDAEQQARETGAFTWSLTWQGVFAGLRLVVPVRGRLVRIWAGWKLRPSDRSGIDPNDYRFPRCGFAIQCKRI